MRLKGKTVLVTAAGQGIGRASALAHGGRGRPSLGDRRQREAARTASKVSSERDAPCGSTCSTRPPSRALLGKDALRWMCSSTAPASCTTAPSCRRPTTTWRSRSTLNVHARSSGPSRPCCRGMLEQGRARQHHQHGQRVQQHQGPAQPLHLRHHQGRSPRPHQERRGRLRDQEHPLQCVVSRARSTRRRCSDRINSYADPVEARKNFVARQPMGRLARAQEIAPRGRVPGQRRIGVRHRPGLSRWTAASRYEPARFPRGGMPSSPGGATGLGYAIAQRLVIASGGMRHAVGPRRGGRATRPRIIARRQGQFAVTVDVSQLRRRSPGRRQAHHAGAFARRIDALVNSAGITGPNSQGVGLPAGSLAPGHRGQFDRRVPVLPRSGRGRCASKAMGASSTSPRSPARTATRTPAPTVPARPAVIGFTKSLGKELADIDVRVNCVTPAAVKTAIFDQMTARAHRSSC
jgi:NAD(P)-dependent dehydrogenase (short-subunit alcohol dehydrogenase family)